MDVCVSVSLYMCVHILYAHVGIPTAALTPTGMDG